MPSSFDPTSRAAILRLSLRFPSPLRRLVEGSGARNNFLRWRLLEVRHLPVVVGHDGTLLFGGRG